jgi:hypothetical protein
MIPTQLSGFFAASTGSAAALIGLLFVAVAINPQRVFGATAAPHAIATSTFLALADAFFVSCGALISTAPLAWIALGMGVLAVVGTLGLAYTLLYQELNPRLVLQRAFLVIASLVTYGVQCWIAVRLLLEPSQSSTVYWLANLLLVVYGIGILRAYGLLGAHFTGLRAWLGPRHYTDDKASAK